jgi:Protein of unknown function (DUF968).
MPHKEITTQVTSHRAKELAQSVTAAFQEVRDAEQDVEDAKKDALRARYEWGREVAAALEESDDAPALKEEISSRIDRTARWVQGHAQFYHEVESAFRGDPRSPIEGYIDYAQDTDRNLSWSAAKRWMQDSRDDEGDEKVMAYKKVERLVAKTEEAVNELAEQYLDRKDDMDEDGRRAMEGVITRANQSLEEARHMMGQEPDEERVEVEAYRRWIADHGCCCCGIIDDTVVPHHPEHVYASRGGVATKINDLLTVPLCHDCHTEVEEMDEIEFWEQQNVDPERVSNRLQAEFGARVFQ